MSNANTAPGLFACLLCSMLTRAANAQLSSAFYSAVQVSGQIQCSTDIPSATLRARSAIECSLRCVGLLDECCTFNFIKEELACELFDKVTSSNCTDASGCTLYKVNTLLQQ